MSFPTAESFIQKMATAFRDYDDAAFEMYFGVVAEVADGGAFVRVKRQGVIGTDADSGIGLITVARVAGPAIVENDLVLCLRDRRDHYVLGPIGGDINMTIPVFAGTGVADTMARSDQYHIDEASRGIVEYYADNSPTTASNNSTSTYATLYSESIVLPDGEWIAQHICLATFKNNAANGGATIRASLPSASGGTTVTCPTANVPFTVFDVGGGSGLTGTQTFAAEYRASSSGTVTPQRWLMMATLRRVV